MISYNNFLHFVVGYSDLESLPFVELRFIAFLFGRYREISNLKIKDVFHEDEGFVLSFKKGKSYQ